ncbi:hypothetical protein [Pricia sp.]|uniref:hypothetical protein n=1 Tax=Pricia sp. TaxID=2268138 RepID=UPI003593176B
MSGGRETTTSRLFLVCPSGFMETPVRKTFGENSYFYTAMGVFFEWDEATQHSLTGFLQRRNISEIHFVGNIDNPWYAGFLHESIIPLRLPWERQIARGYTDLKTEIEGQPGAKMKTQLLLAEHLARQILRLRESPILGSHIDKEGIRISASVYDPSDDSFLGAAEVRRRAMVLQGICLN